MEEGEGEDDEEMRKSVYNQMYEDDTFKQLKEAMFKEMSLLDQQMKCHSQYTEDKHGLSYDITQELKEL